MARNAMIFLLLAGYAATLAVSAGHLAKWYALTLGDLPPFLAVALAVTLELNAFLLSMLSNSTLKGSRWATGGALVALGLVWLGNFRSMERAAGDGVGSAEIFAMSLFIPVGTYVIGKVVGELLEQGKEERPRVPAARETAEPPPQEDLAGDPVFADLLRVLATPMPLREIYRALPEHRDRLPEALRVLERRGAVRNEGGFWVRNELARR
jgi:hypothetical protein